MLIIISNNISSNGKKITIIMMPIMTLMMMKMKMTMTMTLMMIMTMKIKIKIKVKTKKMIVIQPQTCRGLRISLAKPQSLGSKVRASPIRRRTFCVADRCGRGELVRLFTIGDDPTSNMTQTS